MSEAIYVNTPCIASDVCLREEGTILFRNRDFKDLYDKVVNVLENYNIYKEKVIKIKIKNYAREILETYKQININCKKKIFFVWK